MMPYLLRCPNGRVLATIAEYTRPLVHRKARSGMALDLIRRIEKREDESMSESASSRLGMRSALVVANLPAFCFSSAA